MPQRPKFNFADRHRVTGIMAWSEDGCWRCCSVVCEKPGGRMVYTENNLGFFNLGQSALCGGTAMTLPFFLYSTFLCFSLLFFFFILFPFVLFNQWIDQYLFFPVQLSTVQTCFLEARLYSSYLNHIITKRW